LRAEEGERMLLVAAVLGQVQAHLAHRVPGRMPGVKPGRHRPPMRADLRGERLVDLRPPRGDPLRVNVLGTVHRRHRPRQPLPLVGRAVDLHTLAPLLQVGDCAQARHEGAPEVAQEGQVGSERRVQLGRAEVEQRVAGAALDGAREAGAGSGRQAVGGIGGGRRVEEQRSRGQNGNAHRGVEDTVEPRLGDLAATAPTTRPSS
jgi:hypothetical protein